MIDATDTTFVPGSVLSTILDPVDLQSFVDGYWQREPLVLGGRSPDHFDRIFSLKSIDRLLTHCTIPSGNVDMGSNAVGADPAAYKPNGVADIASVLKMHQAGETIILRAMHRFDNGLAQACAAMSSVFRCGSQANVYITPAGTRSSYPHWDAHDIFILQVHGTKVWTLHENDLELPHPDFKFDPNAHPIGEPVGEIEVKPGDTIYVPRGLAHNPYATEHSVHVSLGVQVTTWFDVLQAALRQRCTDRVAVRRDIPVLPGGLGLDSDALSTGLAEILSRAFDPEEVASVAESLLDTAAKQQAATDTMGMLHQALEEPKALEPESMVQLRINLPSRSSAQIAGSRRVLLSGLEFDVEPAEAAMADYVISHQTFRPADLPGDDLACKLGFVQHLLDEGCLTRVD